VSGLSLTPTPLSDAFRRQAESFEALGSPVYAGLAERLGREPEIVEPLFDGDVRWDAPLRLFGAVHQLALTHVAPDALSGRWEDFTAALVEHQDELRSRIATQGVQTNEVKRCTALLPALLTAAAETGLPVELLELGPSAGLNLLVDRYRYRYANGVWGPADARLELAAREGDGRVPAELLAQGLVVRRRRGIDLAPVDATTAEGYLLLRSFLWPGLHERVGRLDAAVETLRELPVPPELIEGDYLDLLPRLLRERPEDGLTVVFDTFSTPYLSADADEQLRSGLDDAGADGRPLAWVSVRRWDPRSGPPDGIFELELRVWPGAPRLAAYVDPHGNWLDWRL
jgi:hypothetical protein